MAPVGSETVPVITPRSLCANTATEDTTQQKTKRRNFTRPSIYPDRKQLSRRAISGCQFRNEVNRAVLFLNPLSRFTFCLLAEKNEISEIICRAPERVKGNYLLVSFFDRDDAIGD